MPSRPVFFSAFLIVATIAAGLTLRLAHLGLTLVMVKYGGSMLWAVMIYWIVSAFRPRWSLINSGLASAGVAAAVELFKLYRSPALDAFRLTLPGALLLGRVFSAWDLLAYAFAIAAGALVDRAMRLRTGKL